MSDYSNERAQALQSNIGFRPKAANPLARGLNGADAPYHTKSYTLGQPYQYPVNEASIANAAEEYKRSQAHATLQGDYYDEQPVRTKQPILIEDRIKALRSVIREQHNIIMATGELVIRLRNISTRVAGSVDYAANMNERYEQALHTTERFENSVMQDDPLLVQLNHAAEAYDAQCSFHAAVNMDLGNVITHMEDLV